MDLKPTPYSNLKIFAHPDKVRDIKDGRRTAPIYIRIKPTNYCNHNCSYCHYQNPYLTLNDFKQNDFIPQDKMMEIVESMKKIDVKAVTFSGGGEPLLYPYINEAMQKIVDAGIDLSIITNGSLLKDESAMILSKSKWVRISIDSINSEKYAKIRGIKNNSFDILCDNIKNFAQIKEKYCELGINFVIGKENYKEVYEVAKLMRSLGVNHVKFAPLINNDTEGYHADFKDEVIFSLHKMKVELETENFKIIDLYTRDFENYEVFKRTYHKCPIKEVLCIIGANAKVYYCHDKAYLSNGVVCDLNNQTLEKGWFSEEVNNKFKEFDAMKQCKHHCVYDTRNNLINSFLELEENHINFI